MKKHLDFWVFLCFNRGMVIKVYDVSVYPRDGELHLRHQTIVLSPEDDIRFRFKDVTAKSLGDLVYLIDENDYKKFKDILDEQKLELYRKDITEKKLEIVNPI